MASFMSLSVHFINKEWKLKSRYLQTTFTPESEMRVNTLNLKSHLQSCHPSTFVQVMSSSSREYKSPGQVGIEEAFLKPAKYKRDSDKWKMLTRNVAKYLVVGNAPFRAVEKPAFREMLQSFDKQYELPSKKKNSVSFPVIQENQVDHHR